LLAYLSEREALEVGPFNDNSLHLRQFRDFLSQSCVPFIRLRSVPGFSGSRRNGRVIVQEPWLGSYGPSPELVNQVPSSDEHHPGHQFGPSWIESIRGLPEANEDVLDSIFGLCLAGHQLPGHLEHQSAELVVELSYGHFVAGSDPMHQHQFLLLVSDSTFLTIHHSASLLFRFRSTGSKSRFLAIDL
jgi:hypothetical protein